MKRYTPLKLLNWTENVRSSCEATYGQTCNFDVREGSILSPYIIYLPRIRATSEIYAFLTVDPCAEVYCS